MSLDAVWGVYYRIMKAEIGNEKLTQSFISKIGFPLTFENLFLQNNLVPMFLNPR